MYKLVIPIILMMGMGLQAQIFQGGVKAGLNFPEKPSINTEFTTISEVSTQVKDQSNAYHLGFYLKFALAGIYIRPELYYSRFNNEFLDVNGSDFSVTSNRLDFPILVGFQPLKAVYIHGGLVSMFYFGDETTLASIQESDYQDFNFGFQLGAGLEIGKVSFEGRFEGAFSDRQIDYIADNSGYDIESNGTQFLVSMGYKF